MPYDHRDARNRVRAAALLKDLAGRLLDASAWPEPERSDEDAVAFLHFRLSNAVGVHVYAADGGWRLGIAFRNLPPGTNPLLGHSAVFPTREGALGNALHQLSLCAARDNLPLPDRLTGLLGFRFDQVTVPVEYRTYARFREKAADEGFDLDNTMNQLARLRYIATGGASMTTEALLAAPDKVKARVAFACCVALALGMRGFSRDDAIWDPEAEEQSAEDTLLPPGPRH